MAILVYFYFVNICLFEASGCNIVHIITVRERTITMKIKISMPVCTFPVSDHLQHLMLVLSPFCNKFNDIGNIRI